jgi:hypothetical protein
MIKRLTSPGDFITPPKLSTDGPGGKGRRSGQKKDPKCFLGKKDPT